MPLKCDVIQHCCLEGNLENTLHFPAGLTEFPDRADFSAAWPILGGLSLLQPQAVHLFLYLHYVTYVSKQNKLGPSLKCLCSLSRIGGIYSSSI